MFAKYPEWSAQIVAEMKCLGWTMGNLATKMGYSRSYLYRVLHEDRVSSEQIRRLKSEWEKVVCHAVKRTSAIPWRK